jgi:hypothetical protein
MQDRRMTGPLTMMPSTRGIGITLKLRHLQEPVAAKASLPVNGGLLMQVIGVRYGFLYETVKTGVFWGIRSKQYLRYKL